MTHRQRAVVEELAARIEAAPFLAGAFLLGSLARGEDDELSDVDVYVLVQEERFGEAWAARAELEAGDVLVGWDDLDPDRTEVGGHKWLTRDLVLVECLLSTPAGGARLADPFTVLVGELSLAERVPRRAPIPRADLERFAQMRVETGRAHPVETAYGAPAAAVRAARRNA